MRGHETHCGRRESLICNRFTMGTEEFFRRSGVYIRGFAQVDRFHLMLDTHHSPTWP